MHHHTHELFSSVGHMLPGSQGQIPRRSLKICYQRLATQGSGETGLKYVPEAF